MGKGRVPARAVRAALLLALTLPFLIPLLRPGWIQSHEGLSYPIRLVEVARCWEDGLWSARWFPDLHFGQGYPFLCFYAPLVFLTSGLAHAAGASLALALKVPVGLATLFGAAGTYRLVRTAATPPAAFAAAALFTYAPYHVRDVFIRGDLAEYLAMGFLPWGVWAVVRLAQRRSASRVALLAAAAALPILSHNILGLLTGGMLALTTLLAMPATDRPRSFGIAAAGGGAGALVLTAFFWAPALHERAFVQIDLLTSGHYVIGQHFASLGQLLGRGEAPGVGQGLPMTFELGWVGIAATLLAPLAGRGDASARRLAAVGALFLAVGVVMTTSLGAPVYRAIPLLRFVQFPWRFLALAALGTAILGGVGIGALVARRSAAVQWTVAGGVTIAAVLLVANILGPKPNTNMPAWAIDPDELRRRPETTTRGEYVPRWVQESERPRGFDGGARAEGDAEIVRGERRAGRWELTVDAAKPAAIVLVDSYYPGWTARAGGETLPVEPQPRTGRVRIEVPAGRREIEVRLEPTPFRAAARILSLVALAAGIVSLGWRRRRVAASA